jgi:glycolate oxidase FAD binding subunit
VASAAGSALVPSAVELLWTDPPVVLRVGVLLEGTLSGVNDRAKRMAELLAAAGATPIVAVSETPSPWPEQEPASRPPGTVVRVTFWVAQLAGVLEALAAAVASAGVRPAVSGPAGAGVLYARLDPETGDDTAARFVRVLRDRLEGVFARSADGSGLVRGGVAVLAAPAPVLAAAGPDAPLPGLDLMRAVKDQFDPSHRMFPGRFPWEP